MVKESAFQSRSCKRHGFDPWSKKIPRAVEQLSPSTMTEPVLQSPETLTTEAHVPWSVGSTRAAPAMRSPCTTARESPREKQPRSNKDTTQPKINKQNHFLNGWTYFYNVYKIFRKKKQFCFHCITAYLRKLSKKAQINTPTNTIQHFP